MGSKACIIIVVMGILGLGSMGLLTNLALSSSPELKRAIEFKTALVKDLGPSVEAVSVKRQPKHAYELLITAAPGGDAEAIDRKAARYFATKHADRAAARLEVSRVAPAMFGCGTPEVYSRREFALADVRNAIAEEGRREKLAKTIADASGCRLLADSRKGQTVRVEVEAPAGAADLGALAKRVEPGARAELRAPPYTTLEVRVSPSPAPGGAAPAGVLAPPAPVELRFDIRGREIGGGSASGVGIDGSRKGPPAGPGPDGGEGGRRGPGAAPPAGPAGAQPAGSQQPAGAQPAGGSSPSGG